MSVFEVFLSFFKVLKLYQGKTAALLQEFRQQKAPLVKGGWFWLCQNRGDSVEITG